MACRKLSFKDHYKSNFKFPFSILTDNITLKENLGSLFRLCDALAVEHLYLYQADIQTTDNKLNKVSRNTVKNVSHSYTDIPLKTIEQLKKEGYTVISLELTTHSVKIQEFNFASIDKICLILGNEIRGVSDELIAASDHCIHIPMLGMNSSMNVINAASIAVFEITRHLP